MKAVLRTRELPFIVTDIDKHEQTRAAILTRGKEALKEAQAQAIINGTSSMTLDEINDEITACRKEK